MLFSVEGTKIRGVICKCFLLKVLKLWVLRCFKGAQYYHVVLCKTGRLKRTEGVLHRWLASLSRMDWRPVKKTAIIEVNKKDHFNKYISGFKFEMESFLYLLRMKVFFFFF